MNFKDLKREITLSKLLRTKEEIEFHSTHTLVYGIYDNDGLESIVESVDWETLEGLEKISISMRSNSLRCRFNSHRDPKCYIAWISKEIFEEINTRIEFNDFQKSKEMLINNFITI